MDKCLADFAAVKLENATVFHGSNLDVLPFMADNSVDSIVTDPPYELGFMGKKWDSTGIAYSVELWRECLRVLKPGGHLLAFGGSRTWHRLAVAIEDAGFEVRDSIAWLYGSGFPKSLDISKAIDKRNGKPQPTIEFREFLRAGKARSGLTSAQIDEALGFTSAVFSPHYVGDNAQIEYPTREKYALLKTLLELDDSFDYLIEWAEAEREVIGQKVFTRNTQSWEASGGMLAAGEKEVKATLPATNDAKKWAGWGTALKPAFEPIVVARKALTGTVAENVLEWGVGGLNIDGSRIGTDGGGTHCDNRDNEGNCLGHSGTGKFSDTVHGTQSNGAMGRWPANIILDEYTAGLLDEQTEGKISQGHWAQTKVTGFGEFGGGKSEYFGTGRKAEEVGGGASRFFYVAKASKRDRNEGLDGLEAKQTLFASDSNLHLNGDGSPRNKDATTKNFHPTVKPTDLMRYLIKLVTPEGGIVLDPFTGSGSTGKAALLDGYQFLGIELTDDYLPIIEGRLKWAEEQAQAEAHKAAEKEQETLF